MFSLKQNKLIHLSKIFMSFEFGAKSDSTREKPVLLHFYTRVRPFRKGKGFNTYSLSVKATQLIIFIFIFNTKCV